MIARAKVLGQSDYPSAIVFQSRYWGNKGGLENTYEACLVADGKSPVSTSNP